MMGYNTIFIETVNGYGPQAHIQIHDKPITFHVYTCGTLEDVKERVKAVKPRILFMYRLRCLWKSRYIMGYVK